MKRYFLLLVLPWLMYACKKGENDPALSLKTRKSRLAGEWKLESGRAYIDVNYVGPSSLRYNFTFVFNGDNMVENGTWSYPHQLYLEIKKDGTFLFSEIVAGDHIDASGEWSFMGAAGEEENKESVLFQITRINSGNSYSTIFNRFSTTFKYRISELRSGRLAINASGFFFQDEKGQFESMNNEYVFTQ